MAMPGSGAPSMMWMRMPGQSWPGAAAAFLAMWIVMMVPIMLPSLIPMLSLYRRAVGGGGAARLGGLTAIVGGGYFVVWTLVGAIVFPLGAWLAAAEMRLPVLARAVPLAGGIAVLLAGAVQFTRWKARHLACCRKPPARTPSAGVGSAWSHGLHLGRHCILCCGNLMAILLVIGVMDLRAMAAVTAAMTAERLAPAGERVARGIGGVVVGVGVVLLARAVGVG